MESVCQRDQHTERISYAVERRLVWLGSHTHTHTRSLYHVYALWIYFHFCVGLGLRLNVISFNSFLWPVCLWFVHNKTRNKSEQKPRKSDFYSIYDICFFHPPPCPLSTCVCPLSLRPTENIYSSSRVEYNDIHRREHTINRAISYLFEVYSNLFHFKFHFADGFGSSHS